MTKNQKGFTLIELLVVVAILAILALLVMFVINPLELMRKSRDSRRLADVATLRKTIDLLVADNKTLPAGTRTTAGGGAVLDCADATNNLIGLDVCKYLSTIPQDPIYENVEETVQTTTGVEDGVDNTAKSDMVYSLTVNADNSYEINAILESTDNYRVVSEDGGDVDAEYEIGTKVK